VSKLRKVTKSPSADRLQICAKYTSHNTSGVPRRAKMGGALEPPLVSLAVTHVYYSPHDPFSLVSAYLALIPQALMVIYVTLIYARREIEVVLMFGGQLLCELANWILKRLIKEDRPKGTYFSRSWRETVGLMR
jgi:hypothetical protein